MQQGDSELVYIPPADDAVAYPMQLLYEFQKNTTLQGSNRPEVGGKGYAL